MATKAKKAKTTVKKKPKAAASKVKKAKATVRKKAKAAVSKVKKAKATVRKKAKAAVSKVKKAKATRKKAVKSRVAGTKQVYTKKLGAELKKIEKQIDALKKKKSKIDTKLHGKYKKTMAALTVQKVAAKKRLTEANAAWHDITKGIEGAWKSLKKSVDKASKEFK
jgi:predicted  nucleic acid-binding Zn-ribbon protein